MSTTISPELVLGLCILGACVATIVGYAVSRLLRKKVLNEHEESSYETNPFHDVGREQRDYMAEVRRRTKDDLWERLRYELREERVRYSAMMGIRGGGGGSGVVGSRYDYAGGVYDERYPSDSGSGSGSGSGPRTANNGGGGDSFEHGSGSTFLEVPSRYPHRRPMSKESRGSLLIDDWEKHNGAFSRTYEGIAAGGLKLEQYRWTR